MYLSYIDHDLFYAQYAGTYNLYIPDNTKKMDDQSLYNLRYPIGKFQRTESIDHSHIDSWIKIIEEFPAKLKSEVEGLDENALNMIYRPGGWTIRQVIHHCADSHMNSFMRFKLALTEETPTIKPYFEDRWATLVDASDAPVSWSLLLLEGLHRRWVMLLKSLTDEDLDKTFIHPEHGRHISLKQNIDLYAWHCKHHLAHIQQAKRLKGKFD